MTEIELMMYLYDVPEEFCFFSQSHNHTPKFFQIPKLLKQFLRSMAVKTIRYRVLVYCLVMFAALVHVQGWKIPTNINLPTPRMARGSSQIHKHAAVVALTASVILGSYSGAAMAAVSGSIIAL